MTHEEAIEYLEKADVTVYQEPKTRTAEALEMAINALEQEQKSEWEHDHEILKAHSEGAREMLDIIRVEIEKLPTKTRTNWDGCCPDINYPEVEYVDVTKNNLLAIIDKYKAESEEGAEE